MSTTQKLKEAVEQLTPKPEPWKTQRAGEHVEFLVAVGNDETASVTMTKEAYDTLMSQDWA
ncbi:hypothetical protein SAMN04487867_10475 [Vreelandella titanicae]|uniref:hypothetical protein n=1 Tax=Vreelandella titanicae TaxID=664683 RepID=UPI000884D88D|nr:hypothetical protein [Halomonas titanicae]SDI28097.1 hypothetical protein SAMN04487867_10475 [Halomonas titanicae]